MDIVLHRHGVTNDVEGEHANERHRLAEGGITSDDFTAKTFNKGVGKRFIKRFGKKFSKTFGKY